MAKSFPVATSKPTSKDPYIYLYNNANNNGKSWCINGKPTDKDCNVLGNCVGWACGRFNHIYNLLTGYNGIKYPNFCCNAEKFIEVAQGYGLTISQKPQIGAIMVWQNGATLNGSDGAGHVAIVEKVYSDTKIFTSESGYGTFTFANYTRTKGNGNWGYGSSYKFRGFIYNPAVSGSTTSTGGNTSSSTTTNNTNSTTTTSSVPSPVTRNVSNNQIKILITNLRVRKSPSLSGLTISNAKVGYYNYTSTTECDGYTWYQIGTDRWVAYSKDWMEVYPAELKVGDKVKLTPDAVVYGTGDKYSPWIYNAELYVRSITGDRVVVSIYESGPVSGPVASKHLVKV